MVIQIIVVKKFYSIIPLLKAYTYIFCERERLAILFGCYSNHAQFEKGKKGFNIATGRKWFLSCLSTYRHTHTRAHTRTHTHTLHTLARKRVCTLNGSIYSGLRTSTCCCCSCAGRQSYVVSTLKIYQTTQRFPTLAPETISVL